MNSEACRAARGARLISLLISAGGCSASDGDVERFSAGSELGGASSGGMAGETSTGGTGSAHAGGAVTGGTGSDANGGTAGTQTGGSGGAGAGAGGTATGGSGGTATSDDPAQYCVDTINSYRATLGLAPYARWPVAEACTDGQCEADSVSGSAHSAFGECNEWAQNECPNYPGPPKSLLDGCLAQMWAEGPGADYSLHGHYLAMSSTQYTKVACGFFETPSGRYWAIQNFQ